MCQMLGPLKPSKGLLPVLSIQPMDMLEIYYIGPISPIAKSGARFICITVDYATKD